MGVFFFLKKIRCKTGVLRLGTSPTRMSFLQFKHQYPTFVVFCFYFSKIVKMKLSNFIFSFLNPIWQKFQVSEKFLENRQNEVEHFQFESFRKAENIVKASKQVFFSRILAKKRACLSQYFLATNCFEKEAFFFVFKVIILVSSKTIVHLYEIYRPITLGTIS